MEKSSEIQSISPKEPINKDKYGDHSPTISELKPSDAPDAPLP